VAQGLKSECPIIAIALGGAVFGDSGEGAKIGAAIGDIGDTQQEVWMGKTYLLSFI
jgi:hypothetical protein